MTVIINSFLGAFGAGLLTLLIFVIKWFYQKIHKDAITLQALAHDAFFKECAHLQSLDSLNKAQSENIEWLYKGYKAQGLNGTGDKLYSTVTNKPVVIDEE